MIKRVLYVEDNPDMLSLVRWLVERELKGTIVDVCASAAGAEQFLNANCYDLIICDLKLPGELGTTIIERVLEMDPNQPVMLMTAYPFIKDEAKRIGDRFQRAIPVFGKFSDKSPAEFITEVRDLLALNYCEMRDRVLKDCEKRTRRPFRLRSASLQAAHRAVA